MNGDGGRIPRRRVDRSVVALDPAGRRRRHGAAVGTATAVMTAGTNERTADVLTSTASFVFGIVRSSRLGRMPNAVVVVMDRCVRSSTTIGNGVLYAADIGISAAACATAV